jgi:hypothetical protein
MRPKSCSSSSTACGPAGSSGGAASAMTTPGLAGAAPAPRGLCALSRGRGQVDRASVGAFVGAGQCNRALAVLGKVLLPAMWQPDAVEQTTGPMTCCLWADEIAQAHLGQQPGDLVLARGLVGPSRRRRPPADVQEVGRVRRANWGPRGDDRCPRARAHAQAGASEC